MRRREFITLIGGTAATWPLTARAQERMRRIGILNGASQAEYGPLIASFRDALREFGYVEGQNIAIEYNWADGQYDRLPAMAADLAGRGITLIFATGGIASAIAAKAATTTIPIVFVNGADPVKLGLVPSLNRPAGNATGIVFFASALEAKRVELLHELVPEAGTIGFLVNKSNPSADFQLSDVQAAVNSIGLKAQIFVAGSKNEIATAFANLVQQRINALAVLTDPLFLSSVEHITALAKSHAVATIAASREFPASGGLISYGPNIADAYRRAADYVARILRGASPADLPVQQSTKFELVINLKTAKALGLTVPSGVLAIADEVIE
jgi:putative tryptophan/tyrosine transport system substrate-binding protein